MNNLDEECVWLAYSIESKHTCNTASKVKVNYFFISIKQLNDKYTKMVVTVNE